MKILVYFYFLFLLKIENDFSNPSFKIHFSFSRKNENENLTNSFFRFPKNWKFLIHFSIFERKWKFKCFYEFNFCWLVTLGWKYLNTLITWRLYPLQMWLIEIFLSTWSLSHEVINSSKQNWDHMQFKINNKYVGSTTEIALWTTRLSSLSDVTDTCFLIPCWLQNLFTVWKLHPLTPGNWFLISLTRSS